VKPRIETILFFIVCCTLLSRGNLFAQVVVAVVVATVVVAVVVLVVLCYSSFAAIDFVWSIINRGSLAKKRKKNENTSYSKGSLWFKTASHIYLSLSILLYVNLAISGKNPPSERKRSVPSAARVPLHCAPAPPTKKLEPGGKA